ncbi:MAG: hypothetical protein KBB32_09725 [Spirochaetia bacterium]|nr:hypothetical protein [Spirochaetia bacterium]
MNLSFLKLRVADDAWVLIDRTEPGASAEPDWSSIARELCHPARGAGAEGLVVVERLERGFSARTWTRAGLACPLYPVPVLCAARWLYDSGRAAGDGATIAGREGDREALVLDPRNFGVILGQAELEPGPGPVPVRLYGADLRVLMADGALPGRRKPEPGLVRAGIVSRQTVRVRRGGVDAMLAAGAVLAAAQAADYTDRDAAAVMPGGTLAVQLADDDHVFVGAEAAYSFRGEFWLAENDE